MKAAWMLLTAVKWDGECHLSAPCGLLAALLCPTVPIILFPIHLNFLQTGEFGSVFVAKGF